MDSVIVAGDSVDFTTEVPDYPPSAGYTLTYRIVPMPGCTGSAVDITSTTIEDKYRTSVSSSDTGQWTAGKYRWSAHVAKGEERHTVDEGFVTVQPDPATATQGFDSRSQAEIALDDARTALANFQQSGGRVKRYQIAGREMEFDAAGDILKLVSYWQNEVTRERAANAQRDGLPDPRRIYLRIGRA